MEKIKKINFNKGGTGATSGRLVIPKEFLFAMGITEDNPNVKLTYEDGKIIIEKSN